MRLSDIPMAATKAPEPEPPPFRALWSGKAGDWARYHLADRATGWAEMALCAAMRPLPPEVPAAVGRALGSLVGRIDARRPYVRFMQRALARIRPELDDAGRAALLARWWRQTGTTHAQYPVLSRLAGPARLTIHGAERLAEADTAAAPTFFLMVHLGNWELMREIVARHMKRPAFALYEPQPSRYQNRMIWRDRAALGFRAFPPARLLPRTLIPLVEGGCNGVFFIDEVSEGECKFPLWGRRVPERSNLIFALKLAHRFGARLQPCHFLRDAPGQASFHLLAPVAPPAGIGREAWVEETAKAMSAVFEPLVAAHTEQWYMLKEMRI